MFLQQDTRLPKKSSPDTIDVSVPADIKPLLGKYPVPMQQMDLTVIYENGTLAVNDPNKGNVSLKTTEKEGIWIDEFDQNKISFDRSRTGEVTAMVIHQNFRFERTEANPGATPGS